MAGYVLEGALNMAHYDNWEEAFYNTSYESRARVYAGQEPGPAIKPWYHQIFDAQMRVYEEYGILPWWLYRGY